MTTRLFIIMTAVGALICRGDEPQPVPPPVAPAAKTSEPKAPAKSAETSPAKPAEPEKAAEAKAARREAMNAIQAFAEAVDQFHTNYDYLPEPISAAKGTDCITDTSAEECLTSILRGSTENQNSKDINFLKALPKTKQTKGKITGGLMVEEGAASLYDPWGNTYKAALDLDFDGKVANPNPKPPAGESLELTKSVIVWSAGPDGKEETWADNITSWESE